MKSAAPSLAECYRILGVPQGASLDEIKHAYRTKAFALHPDLNPSAGASRQFQQLNEAYVILIRLLDSRAGGRKTSGASPSPDERTSRKGREAYREQQERERKEKERREWQEAERQAREREARQEKERREAERREWLRREIERQEAERLARQEQARQEKIRQQEARAAAEREREEKLRQAGEQKRPETYRRSYSRTHAAPDAPGNAGDASAHANHMAFNTRFDAAGSEEDAGDGTKRETLLRDLLEDPFARRVYEDIYSEIQQRKNAPADPPKPKKLSMEWGNKNFQLDLTDGLGGAIKDWMRGQIDEEQELYFPASSLFPGARVRLQIRQGFSRKPRTLEVTLPQDFVVGKPVRLKGMGKKIGRWQGDLYLTFRVKK